MDGPTGRRVRERILTRHRGTIEATIDAADAVARTWHGTATGERSAVSRPLEAELRDRGVLGALLDLLVDAVEVAGFDLPATPAPAPPYLAITGRGPVLRATVEGGRLVVTLGVFEIERRPRRYRLAGSEPANALEVAFREATPAG